MTSKGRNVHNNPLRLYKIYSEYSHIISSALNNMQCCGPTHTHTSHSLNPPRCLPETWLVFVVAGKLTNGPFTLLSTKQIKQIPQIPRVTIQQSANPEAGLTQLLVLSLPLQPTKCTSHDARGTPNNAGIWGAIWSSRSPSL
jgi:hypothetical protein